MNGLGFSRFLVVVDYAANMPNDGIVIKFPATKLWSITFLDFASYQMDTRGKEREREKETDRQRERQRETNEFQRNITVMLGLDKITSHLATNVT